MQFLQAMKAIEENHQLGVRRAAFLKGIVYASHLGGVMAYDRDSKRMIKPAVMFDEEDVAADDWELVKGWG